MGFTLKLPDFPRLSIFFRSLMEDIRWSFKKYRIRWLIVMLLVAAIFIPRLISVGTILTVDEPLWQSRGQQFMKGLASGHFGQTLVAGQPGVTTAWLVGLMMPWHSLAIDQASIAVATGLLILLITYFLVLLWGWRVGILSGFILALDPFLLGHSRVVHTDALLALFCLASLIALLVSFKPLYYGQSLTRRYLVVSAMLAGLGLLTKMFALVFMFLAVIIMGFTCWHTRQSWYVFWRTFFFWTGVIIITVYVGWPALWSDVDRVVGYLTERSSLHAEGTRPQETTSQWWYYLRESFFRLTPWVSLFLPIGLIALLASRFSVRRWSLLALLVTGVSFALVLNLGSDKSDRYILFTTVVLQLVAVYGWLIICQWLRKKNYLNPRLFGIVLFLPIIWQAIDDARLHPYYLAHYNRLYPIDEQHKLGWGEGLERAAEWIAMTDPMVSVASYYPRVFDYFYEGQVVSLEHAENKKYIVLYRSMFERGSGTLESDLVATYLDKQVPPDHMITINGLPYVWIYKQARP